MRITFIGGGNMASALIAGLLQQGHDASQLAVVDRNPDSCARLARDYQIHTFDALCADAVITDVIVLAVKPQQLKEVALQLSPLLATQLVVSIAAGVRAATLSAWLMGYTRIVRSMPNTPAMIGAGVSALYALPEVEAAQRQAAAEVLKAAGSVVWVEDESQMDAVTAVSGSGPAYVFYFMEAMQHAGVGLVIGSGASAGVGNVSRRCQIGHGEHGRLGHVTCSRYLKRRHHGTRTVEHAGQRRCRSHR
jgi:pyrroline-5-carboxylate reductase